MEIETKCRKCEHDYIINIETSENYIQTQPRKDDEFQEFLTYHECPKCSHRQNYEEYHSCVPNTYTGERECGWCDRDMTPTSYYI